MAIQVFDFRQGLREDLGLDVLTPEQSPSLRNCRFLPRGRLTKRRAVYFDTNPSFSVVPLHGCKLLEAPAENGGVSSGTLSDYYDANAIPNNHFGSWSGAVLDNWTSEALVTTTQSGATDIVSVANAAAVAAGIYVEVFSKVAGDAGSRTSTNIFSVTVRFNIADNITIAVVLKDGAGNTLKSGTVTGSGSWKTQVLTWNNVTIGAIRCYLYLQPEAGQTALIHYVKFRAKRIDFFCFGPNHATAASVTAFNTGSQFQQVIDVADTLVNLDYDGNGLYVNSLPVFNSRIQVFPQLSSTYKSPFELGITNLVKYRTANTGYLPPADWNNSDANSIPVLPKFLAVFEVMAGQILVGGNSYLYPNRIWWSEINNQYVWSDFENPGFGGPGFMNVGNEGEEITGISQYRSSLLVFKSQKIYVIEFGEEGAQVVDVMDIGTPWHHSIVSAGLNIYFYSDAGFIRILPSDSRDNESYGWEIISRGIERTHRAIGATRDVFGVYDRKNRRVLWWGVNTEVANFYSCLEYYIDFQSWALGVPSSNAQFSVAGADWSELNNCAYIGTKYPASPAAKYILLWDYIGTIAPNEQSTGTVSNSPTAMNFWWRSGIIHLGKMSDKKKFSKLTIYYNALATNTTYPFTLIIDRNPLLNDDIVLSSERYIRIRGGVEVGDGTTYTTIDTTNGIPQGDLTGAFLDTNSDPAMKVFKFNGIGTCNSIQIEFSDNRIDTDFIIFGFEVS